MEKPKENIAKNIQNNVYLGKWGKTDALFYDVISMEGLNQLVGYIKFKFPGIILYRGQTKDYGIISPNGCRNTPVSEETLTAICKDSKMSDYFGFGAKNNRGKSTRIQKFLVEAALQHYGAKTYCLDFVDNHWSALWFGANDLGADNTYRAREDDEYLYLYMYSTGKIKETSPGIYVAKDYYISDLRRSLPSYFLRPAAQHGWIVRKKKREKYDLNKHIVCVARIRAKTAVEWLGNGTLLSMENFFPRFPIDDAYAALLSRQIRSGYFGKANGDYILPLNTIENYYFSQSFHCSDTSVPLLPVENWYRVKDGKETKIENITMLYELLLHHGWNQETTDCTEKWTEKIPCKGQSASTALLVQDLFGGEVMAFSRNSGNHYYNQIGTVSVDLTSQETTGELQSRMASAHPVAENKLRELKCRYEGKCKLLMDQMELVVRK